MASCEVRIELERDAIEAGGAVAGNVVCSAPELVTTKGVKLTVGWRTHGRGNRDLAVQHELVLYSGNLSGEQRLPFKLVLPKGPLSFHGELVNVEWFCKASVDLAWAIDPKAERTFVIQKPEQTSGYVYGDRHQRLGPESASPDTRSIGCLLLFLLPFIATGIGMFIVGQPLVGAMFTFIPSLMLFFIVKGRIAARKVGEVEMILSNDAPRPGEEVKVTVRMIPAQSFDITDITAVLTGEEKAVSGSGTRKTTHRRTIHEQKVSLAQGPRKANVGEPIEVSGAVRIPDDAPPSFFSHDNDVTWSVHLRVDIPAWPDWTDVAMLGVLP